MPLPLKLLLGSGLAVALCIATCILLGFLLVPRSLNPTTLVPYGSNMPMPIFYSGILGATGAIMSELAAKKQMGLAAIIGVLTGCSIAHINLGYWRSDSYTLWHYSNIIIYMPVVIASALLVLTSIVLLLCAVILHKSLKL